MALPSRLSSGPSSAALVRTLVLQGLPARQQGRRTGGPGWAVSEAGGLPSGLPRAAGLISVLGRANWAGGRLRGPHTTVLTEGSERLSGPVISVGWYCCKIEIHRQGGPLAPTSGARAGPGQGGPASRPTGGQAGTAWGRLGVLLPRPRRAPGFCVGQAAVPCVCLSVCGGGAEEGGRGVSALPMTGTQLQLALLPLNSASRQHCVFLVLQSAASTPGAL